MKISKSHFLTLCMVSHIVSQIFKIEKKCIKFDVGENFLLTKNYKQENIEENF